MTKIYLIRSAQSEGNLYRIAQGHSDGNLTDLGRRQAEALGERFEGIPVDAVYTSDLYRARATACAIYKPKGVPVYHRSDLREVFLGSWEAVAWGNIAYRESEMVECFHTAPGKWKVDGAETAEQVYVRMVDSVRQIADENDGKSIAVVSHGFAIRLLLAYLLGIPLENAHDVPAMSNTAIAVIEADDGSLRLSEQDDPGCFEDERRRLR